MLPARFATGDRVSSCARPTGIEPLQIRDLVVAGSFAGTINFGAAGDELTSAGNDDAFIARFDASGGYMWSYRFGDAAANQAAQALATDLDGAVIVAGDFAGTLDIGGNALTSQGSTDVFVTKFGHYGDTQFAKSFGDGAEQQVTGISVDANYEIALTGLYAGTINFGSAGDELSSQGGKDIYLAKVDGSGDYLWSKSFGDGDDEQGRQHGVAVDDGANVVLFGGVSSAIDLGAGLLAAAGATDVYLAKYTATGTLLYGKRFGDSSAQTMSTATIDPQRRIVTAGSYQGSLDFGAASLTNSGQANVFVAAFTP